MPTVFLNGGAPNYTGFVFNNTTTLLTTIRDTLVSAGWTVTTDSIVATSTLLIRGSQLSEYCWAKFTVTAGTLPNSFLLQIQGDLLGNNATLSSILTLEYYTGANNQLWITADESAFCMCTIPYSGTTKGIHFGFVKDRVSSSDVKPIYFGLLTSTYTNKFVAENPYNATKWYTISNSYLSSAVVNFSTYSATTVNHTPYFSVIDRFTVPWTQVPPNGLEAAYTNTSVGYALASHRGQVNPITDKPILGDYYVIESGSNSGVSISAVSTSAGLAPKMMYYRGLIRFASVGLASLPGGAQVITTASERYLSVGDVPTDRTSPGWQGFRIL
jgi:hypothetical protein